MDSTFKMAPYQSKYHYICIALCAEILTGERCRKNSSVWSKKWLQKRTCYTHMKLVKELDADEYRFHNFMRMVKIVLWPNPSS